MGFPELLKESFFHFLLQVTEMKWSKVLKEGSAELSLKQPVLFTAHVGSDLCSLQYI